MKYYQNYLTKKNINVKYLDWSVRSDNLFKMIMKTYGGDNILHIIDPIDKLLEAKIKIYSRKYSQKIKFYESPSFLSTKKELQKYIDKFNPDLKKRFFQHSFYVWQRHRLNILIDKKNKPIGGTYSFDKLNRKSIPDKDFIKFTKGQKIDTKRVLYKSTIYSEAIKYCEKTFTNHYPDNYEPKNIYYYPITHNDSKKHLLRFLLVNLKYFGTYEDAIDTGNNFLFHSIISPQLNNGLINPSWILENVLEFYNTSNKKKNIIASVEGFIRQLNWREYSRLTYIYIGKQMISNYFNHKNKLSSAWYTGKTGIKPIDHTIKCAFKYGYIHHILRLMVMCNFMNLCQINPKYVYNWFIEFSLDSYDWVMINNVYSMGLFADGGLTMTKPYISSSNYILKQSNFKKDGTWDVIWDNLYYYFISVNYDKLKGRAAIYRSHWNKKKDKNKIIALSKKYIKQLTK